MSLFEITNKYEFFGIINAFILIIGLYQVGDLLFKIKQLKKIISEISEIKYQKIFLSTNIVLLVFYPLILYSNKINFIPIISTILFCFGLFKIVTKFKKKFKFVFIKFNKNHIDKYLVLICIFGLLFLSLAPNTHSDSLGYHFIVAKKLLTTGNYYPEITHYHTFLGGSGEIMIALGLFFGSEQFGGLIQFSGLLSIFGVFKKFKNKKKYYFILLVLTSPIILFLSSTAKPQLFHICSSAVIFSLYLFGNSKYLSSNEQKWKILLSLIVLIVSINSKFNLLISSFLIGAYIFYISFENKKLIFFIFSSTVLIILFYLPIIFWKYLNFGGNFYEYFYSPFPLSIPGIKEFTDYLSYYGKEIKFINFVFPKNLNQFTRVIGISIFYILLLNLKNNTVKIVFFITSSHILINYFFGQFIGRSLLEPLFWILLVSAKYGNSINLKPFEYFCRIQSIIVIAGIFYGVFFIFPGSLSKLYKDRVLSQNASGYSLFKWANSKLKEDDVVVSTHRSISLGRAYYVSIEFLSYLKSNNKNSKIIYDNFIKKNPKYFLTMGYFNQKPYFGRFKDCVGKLKYYKSSIGRHEARNIFNRGNIYDGYIYEFDVKKFPECLEKK
tara:strand:- start:660 stop:2489 length:1830 start_codon:yes stop_codon:yes gene_type:complete